MEKLYARVKHNPKDVAFADLDRLLEMAGFTRRQPASGSSHFMALEAMRGEMPDE